MTKKSIDIDLNDPRAEKIANAISRKTAKKILHLLADREMSGSEIASELGAPLNTVSYNLKKLVEAGLVDKSKKMFWSSKGNRMELYTLANKRIIISPKVMTRSVVAGIVCIFGIALIALLFVQLQQFRGTVVSDEEDSVKSFKSLEEIEGFLKENLREQGSFKSGILESFATDRAGVAAPAANREAAPARAAGADDYSETNIQVEGVDEPDIVKNDGKYIYVVSGKKVTIVDAYPVENMEVLSKIELEDYARNIFVNDDKLIVFMNKYEYIDTGIRCYGGYEFAIVRCGGYSKESTLVHVYDISDRENPILKDEIELAGNYIDARMIDNSVYLISSKYLYFNGFELPVYTVNGIGKAIAPGEVYYFDSNEESYVFNSISAINLNSGEVNTEVYLMGASTSMYVSQDSIYLTYMKRVSQEYYFEKQVEEVILPLLPPDEREKVGDILDSDEESYEKGQEIDKILQRHIISLGAREGVEFLSDLEDAMLEFSKELQKEYEKTVIHKISIDEENIEYEGKGEVPGNVLNQFSMDEFEGNFRIATTTGNTWDESSLNHLYVLNEDLEIIGSVENLAEGERIYSARFMGERAYMVTFRQVDPLYAVDLSNPRNPEILGYLKVTGYSSYLHLYDENHIIGVGQEADERGSVRGVKISLFDVTNVANPREIGKYEVKQGKWSYSEALYDHKAFLFDKERSLLVIPVSYSDEKEYWQGAFVFNIDLSGINLKGKIDHELKEKSEYYYGGDYVIRSLYMGDVLYTISNKMIKASDLGTLSEINFVDLPYEDYYVYGGGVAVDAGVAAPEAVDSVE